MDELSAQLSAHQQEIKTLNLRIGQGGAETAALNSFPDRILRDDWVGGAKKEVRRKYGQKNRRR
jgi:hypothetical protein